MKKLAVRKTLSEIFSTYFKSLPALFKNNWLLFIVTAAIGGWVFVDIFTSQGIFITHLPNKFGSPEPSHMPTIGMTFLILLFFYMLLGYTVRYVNTDEHKPIGLRGLYINMPLIKTILSVIFSVIILYLMLLATMILALLLLVIIAGLGAAFTGAADLPAVSNLDSITQLGDYLHQLGVQQMGFGVLGALFVITAIIILIAAMLIWPIYLAIRFVTVAPYSFLHNKVSVFKPFAQTKSNALRIFIVYFVTQLVYMAFFGLLMLLWTGLFSVTSLSGETIIFVMPVILILLLAAVFALSYLPLVATAVIYKGLNEK